MGGLRIEKWINASANGRIQMSSPSTISSYQNSASSLLNKSTIHSYHNILPESCKIEPRQWQEEWKAKQQLQRNMMEQYASLVATSRFNMVKQTIPQSMQKKRNHSLPNSRNNTRTIVNMGQNNDISREQNEETGNKKLQPSPKARRLLEDSLLQRISAVVPLSKLEEWDLL